MKHLGNLQYNRRKDVSMIFKPFKKWFTIVFPLLIINAPSAQFTEQANILLTGVSEGSIKLGDYNNDGLLDILLTGTIGNNQYISKVYKNNGDTIFLEQTDIVLSTEDNRSASWGDYNNDGYLDILIGHKVYINVNGKAFSLAANVSFQTGWVNYLSAVWGDYNNDGLIDILTLCGQSRPDGEADIRIFKNNGNESFTEQKDILLPGVRCGTVVWNDFNNDGFLDFLLCDGGFACSYPRTHIYQNNGDGTFTERATNIKLASNGSVVTGDYNNDGFLDILSSGLANNDPPSYVSKLYKNNGDWSFTEQTNVTITGVTHSSAAWGDFNNDGYSDILLSGYASGLIPRSVTNIYINNKDGSFSEKTDLLLPKLNNGFVNWGDYDKDGKLDILLMGVDSNIIVDGSAFSRIAKIFRNTGIYQINQSPPSPDNLHTDIKFNNVECKWDMPIDDLTPPNALSYNIRIGTAPGGCNIVSPNADYNGFCKVPRAGNVGTGTNIYRIQNVLKGTYYWSVQAIDNSFQGGPWSAEQVFTITSTQASNIVVYDSAINSLKIKWNNGNGERRVVFMSNGTSRLKYPLNNISYTADSTFSLGSQIDSSGWYCVYNEIGNAALIMGLHDNTNYTVAVFEYTGIYSNENYNTCVAQGNPIVIHSKSFFSELPDMPFAPDQNGPSSWGDYNNDGFIDILICGKNKSTVYKNNGNSTFSLQENLSGSTTGAWGDYDNDGLLDILLIGGFSTPSSKLYKNNGNGTFSEQKDVQFTQFKNGSVAWGDYNNDGYLDVLLAGNTPLDCKSIIYKNNENGSFSEQANALIAPIDSGSIAWGDYNIDGYLDILLTGKTGTERVSKVYKNNGDGSFTDQTNIALTPVSSSSAAWGDYNNDGYLDIVISGLKQEDYIQERARIFFTNVTKVYKNNGDGTFTAQDAIPLTGVREGSVSWGDYNADGFLDLLIAGTPTGYYQDQSVTEIYQNNGNGTFTKQLTYTLPAANFAVWGDYNNDENFDIAISRPDAKAMIFKSNNNIVKHASKLNFPVNLRYNSLQNQVVLKWDKIVKNGIPDNSLSYNVRIGTRSGDINILSPASSLDNGFLRKPTMGNAGKIDSVIINYLPDGNYFWSVQAVDNSFSGGDWAKECLLNLFCTGINKSNTANNKNIWFTPIKNVINFTQNKPELCLVTMYDISGRMLIRKQVNKLRNQICVNKFGAGLYFMKITTEKKELMKKKFYILK